MALGRTGRPVARLGAGALFTLLCLVVCVGSAAADPGEYLEAFGPDGTTSTEFGRTAGLAVDQGTGAVYVGDSEGQTLYKFNAAGDPLAYGGAAGYISGNEITGLALNEAVEKVQVAVDSVSHVIYVPSANKIRAFEANGEPHEFTAGPGAGTSEIPGATELLGLAVDESGNIYASDFGSKKIRIYTSSGELLTEFAPIGDQLSALRPGALAVAPDGTLYVIDFLTAVYAFEPSKFPLTAKTTFGLGSQVNKRLSISVGVDPATQYVYIAENCEEGFCQFPATSSQLSVYDERGKFVGLIGGEGPGELEGVVTGIGVNGEEHKLYAGLEGFGGGLSQVSVFESLPIPKGPPTIEGAAVTDLTSSGAVLRARINPNTLETTYWFEYGSTDCAAEPGSCTKIPAGGASVGSGHNPVAVSAALSGLAPGTKYFFRVVAENSLGASESATRAFTTQAGDLVSQLSDNRVWEQVTPATKFGGVPTNSALIQADPFGGGIAFHTHGSVIEDPESNRSGELSAVLARRTESGWSVSDLVPRHTQAGGLGFGPEFKLFTPDLGKAIFEPRDDTPLSPEASERAPYLRFNTSPPSYQVMVTSKEGFANVPPGTVFGGEANGARNPVSISAANSSLTHVVLSSETPLVPGAAPRSIYIWSNGALSPVSELPAAEGGGVVQAQPGSGTLSVRHAVSEDGSRVFWAPGDPLTSSLDWPALYLRDTVAKESFRLDLPEAGASGAGEPHPAFMAASADGSVVYFTDSQQLTEDASPEGRDLYRCEIGEVGGALGCTDLEDLSAPMPGSGENANAEEMAVGISEDGGSVYFMARAVLDPEPNGAGEEAVPGSPNLYLWQEGVGTRFIAPLSEKDAADWGEPSPTEVVAHAANGAASSSPDGRYLAFMSEEKLAGSETADPESGQPVEQAFVYDATEDQLICISCNPSGAADPGHQFPKGATEGSVIFPDRQGLWTGRLVGATLPEPNEGEAAVGFTLYWPRAVLNNGRAYFNSTNPLVIGDSNGTWDAYQYEPFGTGDCTPTAGSGMVATTETGCVALVSSGSDSLPSVYMDASASGDDVFFATFDRLSPLDTDDIVDVYDARVDGVKAVVEQHPECSGEACQQRGLPPSNSAPGSATFQGAGNIKAKPHKRCRHGQRKVHRKGKVKCVPKKKGGGKHKNGGGK